LTEETEKFKAQVLALEEENKALKKQATTLGQENQVLKKQVNILDVQKQINQYCLEQQRLVLATLQRARAVTAPAAPQAVPTRGNALRQVYTHYR
jgi:hypothetical protein